MNVFLLFLVETIPFFYYFAMDELLGDKKDLVNGGVVSAVLEGRPMLLDGKKEKALLFAGSQYARISYIP